MRRPLWNLALAAIKTYAQGCPMWVVMDEIRSGPGLALLDCGEQVGGSSRASTDEGTGRDRQSWQPQLDDSITLPVSPGSRELQTCTSPQSPKNSSRLIVISLVYVRSMICKRSRTPVKHTTKEIASYPRQLNSHAACGMVFIHRMTAIRLRHPSARPFG